MAALTDGKDDRERRRRFPTSLSVWRRKTDPGGYRRIQGALANVGHVVARTTIADILKRHGIEPAPERSRKTTWKDFLKRHWDQIVATDFFTVEVWTPTGLQRLIVLFFMDLSTRRVELGGIARSPNGFWMSQIARNLTDAVDGFFMGKRFLIHDRDPLYTTEFLDILAGVGVQSVKLPPRSPNLNAHAERFVRTIKEGCLDQMIFFGEDSLRLAIYYFILHYHLERNHQGLGNRLIVPSGAVGEKTGPFKDANGWAECLVITTETPPDEMQNDPVTCKIEFLDTVIVSARPTGN